ISRETLPGTRERGDDARWGYLPYAVVTLFRNVEIAGGVQREALWEAQLCRYCRAAISAESRQPRSSKRRENAGRIDFENLVAGPGGDVGISRSVADLILRSADGLG